MEACRHAGAPVLAGRGADSRTCFCTLYIAHTCVCDPGRRERWGAERAERQATVGMQKSGGSWRRKAWLVGRHGAGVMVVLL